MIYIMLYIFLMLCLLISNRKNKEKIYFLLLIIYIFFFGFAFELGMDYYEYKKSFLKTENLEVLSRINFRESYFYKSSFEKGYMILVLILKTFTNQYIYVSFLNMLLILILFSKFIKKYSSNIIMSLLILLRGDIFSHLGGSRQGIAQGFYLYALSNIENNKFINYCFWILLGSFFHKSIILFLPIYFIIKKIYKTKHIFLFIFLTILLYFIDLKDIFKFFLLRINIDYLDKYLYYLNDDLFFSRRGLNINAVISFVILQFLLIKRKKIEKKVGIKRFNIILNNFLLGFFVNIGLNSVYIISYRLSQYFQIFDIIIYTYIYSIIKNNKIKIIYILVLLLYCYFSFSRNMLGNNYFKYAPYRNYFFIF